MPRPVSATEPRVLGDLLDARADADPGGVALRVAGVGELTFAEWGRRARLVTAGLRARGVRPGERVAVALGAESWMDVAVAYIGILDAGAVAVPVGTRFAAPELARVLAHAGAVAVLGPSRPELPIPGPAAGREAGTAWVAPVGAVEAGGGDGSGPEGERARPAPSDLAEILYTSGTTGEPKGVAVSHAGLMVHDLPPEARGEEAVTFLHAFPPGTQAGQETLRVPLRIPGRTALALPTFDAELACELVERHRVVRLQLVPATAQVLLASGAWRRYDLSSLRRVVLSSAAASPSLLAGLDEAFPGATVWNAYALTEAGGARTLTRWDPERPLAVGRGVGRTEVRVTGAGGEPVGPGVTGEVWLRHAGAPTRWYHGDPEATAGVFVDGWVRTGDLGHLDGNGTLHLSGRAKDVIITGGANVSAVEVEHALAAHPAVVEAAVVGVAHPTLGEDVAAVVVVRAPTPARELQDVVRSRLAEHKVPHRIAFVDELPRNAGGKAIKAGLADLFAAEPASEAHVAPRDPTEAAIAGVWAAVLERGPVGVDDDFFALGGHSLAAAQIAARLTEALGVEVGAAAVFEAPTVAELARTLKEAGARA